MKEAIVRGILIGASLAVILSIFTETELTRAFFAGGIAGLLAGLTKYFIERARKK
jgi:hypothetical protein